MFKFIKKSLDLDPNYVIAVNNIGNALDHLHRYEESIPYHEKAIELDSTFHYAWMAKGRALTRLNKPEEGLEYIETSIESMRTVSQFENEYNPVHFHTEMKSPEDISSFIQVSSVLYLKVPKNTSRNLKNKKQSPDGAIEFISQGFGSELQSLSTGSRRFRPVVGHLYICLLYTSPSPRD